MRVPSTGRRCASWFLAHPGAGKGTQAARLARCHHIPHIATGDLFREATRQPDELGRHVQMVMEKVELISDELTNGLVALIGR
ncbi:MAG: nucleoside monophosphate kinase [Actinomycetota bacterium]